jgi:DNA repair protein RadC
MDVSRVMIPVMRDLAAEEMHLVCLTTAGHLFSREMISRGNLSSSIVDCRMVFQRALLNNAAAIVLVHNHPSGNPEPSPEDIALTRQITEAGRLLGIPLRDHLIIAGDSWTSLAERGAV